MATRENAKQEIKERLSDYLQGKGINPRRAFSCLNPAHPDKNPSMSYHEAELRCKCFSCGASYDIFDLIGLDYGLTDFNDQLKKACELYSITIDEPRESASSSRGEKREESFSELYKRAHSHIGETDYIKRRGLSQATADRFNLGFIAEWKHPKAPKAPTSPRLIIPVTNKSYTARDTRATIPADQEEYKKSKVKAAEFVSWIFNAEALTKSQKPVFIVEGEIDAMSIYEAGGEAVAIGSTAYTRAFIDYLKAHKPTKPLLLALDTDKAGRAAQAQIGAALDELGVIYYKADIAGLHKDANEALLADREKFSETVRKYTENPKAALIEEIKATKALEIIKKKMETGSRPVIVPTGFPRLDELLNGGLRAGLYTLGAISSLGKTSFIVQLADNIASSGRPVLFVSLEMAREELLAKIISRLTYERSLATYGTFNTARTTVGVLNTHNFRSYDIDAQDILSKSIEELEARAERLLILEGMGDIDTATVKALVRDTKKATGQAPVVFIDYLQILAPPATNREYQGTDKQITDKNILELKRLSRDENTPVFVVSSFNRDNYLEPVNLSSFKESGAIEYTSDLVLGLQLEGMDYQRGENEKTRKERITDLRDQADAAARAGKAQEVELKILKNRNGKRGRLALDFVPMFNYYRESTRDAENEYKAYPGDDEQAVESNFRI